LDFASSTGGSLMDWWIKLAASVHRHPKCRAAGYDGTNVFIWLLCLNGDRGFDGVIPGEYVTPGYVAAELGLSPERAEGAIEACKKTRLISLAHSDRRIINYAINGWNDEWKPQPSNVTQRVRKHRERLKARNVSLHVKRNVTDETDETLIRSDLDSDPDPPISPKRGTAPRLILEAVLSYWEKQTGQKRSASEQRIKAAKRILSEAGGDEDKATRWMKRVVWSKTHGHRPWLGDEKMEEHLTPETLFRKCNFTKYLEQANQELGKDDEQDTSQVHNLPLPGLDRGQGHGVHKGIPGDTPEQERALSTRGRTSPMRQRGLP
jgi:hypothetical protein